jgi:hypothetical protein
MMSIQPISDESFNTLIGVMEKFLVLSFKFKTTLRSMLFETTFPRNKRILNFSQLQEIVWFMLDGLAMEIREDEYSLNEKTSWFWLLFDFMYTDPGFFSQQNSTRAIHIMEASKVVLISYRNWKVLHDTFEETNEITELIRGNYAQARQQHAEEIKNLSTEDRYLNNEVLLNKLFGRVKLKYIAEFMGMAPDTLGKLRKKHARKKR